jgi:putative protease
MPEEEIGKVASYFSKIGVAAIDITKGILKVGDKIHIKGHTTDIEQDVDSIQIEHQNVPEAKPGDSIGIKVKDRVRDHDIVYKVLP